MARPASSRYVAQRIRRRVCLRRLTNARAEWLIGDRDEEPGVLSMLREYLPRLRA